MQLLHLVLGRPTGLLPFTLASKLVWGVFPMAFCLREQINNAEIFRFGEVAAQC